MTAHFVLLFEQTDHMPWLSNTFLQLRLNLARCACKTLLHSAVVTEILAAKPLSIRRAGGAFILGLRDRRAAHQQQSDGGDGQGDHAHRLILFVCRDAMADAVHRSKKWASKQKAMWALRHMAPVGIADFTRCHRHVNNIG
jgi:hypothetical protein